MLGPGARVGAAAPDPGRRRHRALFVPEAPPALAAAQPNPGDEGLAILSPLVRKVLGQMPVPVMLLDDGARVLFVNEPMRTVVGPSAERKPISTVLRNPEVLTAIAQTSADGEPATRAIHRRRCRSSGITRPIRRG